MCCLFLFPVSPNCKGQIYCLNSTGGTLVIELQLQKVPQKREKRDSRGLWQRPEQTQSLGGDGANLAERCADSVHLPGSHCQQHYMEFRLEFKAVFPRQTSKPPFSIAVPTVAKFAIYCQMAKRMVIISNYLAPLSIALASGRHCNILFSLAGTQISCPSFLIM